MHQFGALDFEIVSANGFQLKSSTGTGMGLAVYVLNTITNQPGHLNKSNFVRKQSIILFQNSVNCKIKKETNKEQFVICSKELCWWHTAAHKIATYTRILVSVPIAL